LWEIAQGLVTSGVTAANINGMPNQLRMSVFYASRYHPRG